MGLRRAGLGVVLVASLAGPVVGASGPATPSGTDGVATRAVPTPAPRADAAAARAATNAALGDLGLALLRAAPGPNAVVSPLAVATALGLVQSGATGATEREIEALFGAGQQGALAMRRALPALSAELRAAGAASPAAPPNALRQAAHVWIDNTVASDVPSAFRQRVARRHGAQATVLSFADTEAARAQINRWTAEHTAGRITELLPAGSLGSSTQVTLTAAVHFRAAWAQPFDPSLTEPRPFAALGGSAATVPTLNAERTVAQAQVDGTQLYAVPFEGGYDLIVAVPGVSAGGPTAAWLEPLRGASFARWQAALATASPVRCAFAMPKFNFAPKAATIKPTLQSLGVKTAFTERAELRPMLGRKAAGAHVDDVLHAAGIAVDEAGGEAVAAAAATIKPKSLALAAPACAVDRAFAFVLMHRASGAPVFVGRVGDPALN